MISRPLWLSAILLGLLSAPLRAQSWSAFTRAFDAYAAADSIVGGSAILIRDGRTVERYNYGFADRAARRRVDGRTIFHWASVTKTLTAIAILQLRDRKLLSLDDPVTRWVPELRRVHAPAGQVDSITIRTLLSHSSGLQAATWPWTEGEPWEPFEPTAWEQLVAMMPYQKLQFAPGAQYSYSNPGYIYLARIIEAVTGDPWAVYIQKNLWSPLGMTQSYVGATPYHLAQDRSHGYRIADTLSDIGADFDPGVTIPNSGWNAPLDDLALYLGSLMGASGQRAVLARGTLEEMWRPMLPTGAKLPELSQVGLGFFSTEVDGRRIVGHTGDQAGYRSFVYFDPERRTGLVMVFNTTNDAAPGHARLEEVARAGIALLR